MLSHRPNPLLGEAFADKATTLFHYRRDDLSIPSPFSRLEMQLSWVNSLRHEDEVGSVAQDSRGPAANYEVPDSESAPPLTHRRTFAIESMYGMPRYLVPLTRNDKTLRDGISEFNVMLSCC
jgi:hypothetical protein